jgi:hypothetical protein
MKEKKKNQLKWLKFLHLTTITTPATTTITTTTTKQKSRGEALADRGLQEPLICKKCKNLYINQVFFFSESSLCIPRLVFIFKRKSIHTNFNDDNKQLLIKFI